METDDTSVLQLTCQAGMNPQPRSRSRRRAWHSAAATIVLLVPAEAAEVQSTIDARQLCERTPRVRDAIVEAIPGATVTCVDAQPDAMPPVTAHYETNIAPSQLAGIRYLDLIRRRPEPHLILDDFRPGDFDGLSGVRELRLLEAFLPSRHLGLAAAGIPADVLGRLELLVFANCDVSRIESVDFFEGLTNLRELLLLYNNLTHELPGNPNRPEPGTTIAQIDPAVWRHLPNLRKLQIGSNRILTLPRGFFEHLTKLEELDMYDMWYEYHPYGFGSQALPGGIFEGLSNLRRLDLGYNAIGQTEVDDGLFDGLTSLEHLNLRDNPLLTVLPRSVLNLPAGVTVRTDPGVEWPTRNNRPATGSPTIRGTARVGETLTAIATGIEDEDGLDNVRYEYHWLADDTAISGANGATYIPADSDEGKAIRVRVSFTDDEGNDESLTSAATAAVTAANRSPEAVGSLPALVLRDEGAETMEVESGFRDPDGDALTYAAESSDRSVARVSVSGSMVTVTPSSRGLATVRVTATDVDGSNRSAEQTFAVTVGYDVDGDGLIGIHTLAQLDAVRHDLDGDGAPAASGAAGYGAAFGLAGGRTLSCAAAGGCRGYELRADLDFDTNASGGPDAGDSFWNGGAGWSPLGTSDEPFAAVFEGNGRVIRHLFIDGGNGAGLFGATGSAGVIRHVGLAAVDVAGADGVGGLAGTNAGLVTGSYATGRVSATAAAGGLVGTNAGRIGQSYAAVRVTAGSAAGGLAGVNEGVLAGVYATGRVSATRAAGGLVGTNRGTLTAGYATGRVAGGAEAEGLIGVAEPSGTVNAAYWDTDTSGHPAGAPSAAAGAGRSTAALQEQTAYAGPYAAWDVDVDGDGAADAPWHFGTAAQYPALSPDADGDGRSTWQEMGRQLRAGPAATATPTVDPVQVVLTWTGVETRAWTPAPELTYTVYREAGGTIETIASGVRGLRYADAGGTPGSTYAYQVAAVAGGGEAVRSALVTAVLPCTYAVTPLHRDVLWTADTGAVEVTTGPACTWAAASEADFLAVTGGADGAGSGTVTYTVAPNASGPRTGALAVAGRGVTVFQAAATQFADHPIRSGVTPVRAIHFRELRARIDALRTGANLTPFRWTDPALTPGVTPIGRVHVAELRTALAQAYAAAGRPAPAYTDANVTAGATAVRAVHLMELRNAVLTLE